MDSTASSAAPPPAQPWTVRSLVARHRLGAAVAGAAIFIMLTMILVAVFGAKAGAVSDTTSCTQWGSTNQDAQSAYARLYFREHGPLPGGKSSPASIVAAINTACTRAYVNDVSDTTSVVQALTGRY